MNQLPLKTRIDPRDGMLTKEELASRLGALEMLDGYLDKQEHAANIQLEQVKASRRELSVLLRITRSCAEQHTKLNKTLEKCLMRISRIGPRSSTASVRAARRLAMVDVQQLIDRGFVFISYARLPQLTKSGKDKVRQIKETK